MGRHCRAVLFAAGVVGAVEPGRTSFVRPRLPAVCSCAPQHLFGRSEGSAFGGAWWQPLRYLSWPDWCSVDSVASNSAPSAWPCTRCVRAVRRQSDQDRGPDGFDARHAHLAQEREAFFVGVNPNHNVDIAAGFGWIVSPLSEFAGVLGLRLTGQLPMHYFETLFASVVFWIPRSLWSGKPVGFGSTFGDIFHPELQGPGSRTRRYSSPSRSTRWDIGLVLMVPAVGIGVRWLDRRVEPIWERSIATTADLLKVALATIFIAGLPDLVWPERLLTSAGQRSALRASWFFSSLLLLESVLTRMSTRNHTRHEPIQA